MIREFKGDVFESGAPVIAHGCNTVGVMGAGIAKEIRKRYPEMHEMYVQKCDEQTFNPGDIYLHMEDGQYIANLATQKYPGRNAKIEYIVESVSRLVQWAERHQVSHIAMPRIGAGIGGLAWDDVLLALEVSNGSSTVDIHCYYL
ncbi:phosphatase [Rhodococcus phage Peregrin]|nr:phosphatase [Rhodococcus phage Peregrin]